jgi:hypothetical protein
METTNSNDKSKPRRRRGLLADEIAKGARVSRYKAKQAIQVSKHAPELLPFVVDGQLPLKQAIAIMKHAPELIPYVVSGELPCAECDGVIGELRQLGEPELTFEEEVERSFRKWLSKWPTEERREVRDIVDMMPSAKSVDLMTSQEAEENLEVEIDLEMTQRKNKPKRRNKQDESSRKSRGRFRPRNGGIEINSP